jgi:3'-phosphoadenosine 5'-phosphosulfate sulfotransferase (PAPS reductase)/FAD synthetase
VSSLPVVQVGPLQKAERVVRTIRGLLEADRPLSISWSGGKDSSAVLNLALVAAAEARADGVAVPPFIITHGDTGIENPEIAAYARAELAKVADFAKRHGLDVRIHIATPSLSQSWAYRTIGQGKLPTFPGDPRECSIEFKIKPQARLLKQVMAELRAERGGAEPVVLIGTRFSESDGRDARMQERGERPEAIWKGSFGFDYLSPIADWTIGDVWAYLGLAADLALFGGGTGSWLSYSDFQETLRIYAAATGSECGVAGDKMEESVKRAEACGARFGATSAPRSVGTGAWRR